ncbi:Cysteine desulfurase [Neochlamydia sp. TUME1]|uniref:cysteine desulfurase family protein n=1 Tax=Neochlamydia sp. TUME1 TaxID=1478174 RepID=UPI00057C3633|nr:cysteine desulfurase family protein [Neochlamydia sp. TUME1]KIC74913.1 Cysteine desulfurase [Neochlamydia sp. TUME1]
MKRVNRIYLDNNASTCVDPHVIHVMTEVLRTYPGNPSSPHSFGREARQVLSQARQTIASYLKVRPQEIVFTSGGTEGANMAIRGILGALTQGHIVTSNVEHACVHSVMDLLHHQGIEVTSLAAGLHGAVLPKAVAAAICPHTRLIALIGANNETGVKTDIKAIAKIAEEANIPFFVDGVALLGKEPLEIPAGVSAMSFSGHKIHAPKGCGFIYLKSSQKLLPLLHGGLQEYNRRGGTENLADIAGMAAAIQILAQTLPEASEKMLKLRIYFEESLKRHLGEAVHVNGEGDRVCNTVNLAFDGIDGETLLAALDMAGIAASHGSACASGAMEPSRILLNMGIPLKRVRESIRFSLSRYVTQEEIDRAINIIVNLVAKLKAL